MSSSDLQWPNWLGVVVEEMATQRRFYRDALGLKELGARDDWVHFDMGFPNILELLQRSDDPQYDRPRFQPGFAVEDIQGTYARLIEQDVQALLRSRVVQRPRGTG